MIAQQFGSDAPIAEAIVMAESSGNPGAINYNTNGSIDYGLFQINSIHSKRVNGDLDALLDIQTNVKVAGEIYKEQGFRPWVTYNTGKYLKFLRNK